VPPRITCASALPGKTRKHENRIFHSIGLCYTQCTCALSSWKKKLSSVMCVWCCLTFVEIVRYPIKTVHWLLLQAWQRKTPTFYTVLTLWRTWLTQNMWVTDSRMPCSLPRSCLVHPVDRFDSEGWFGSDQVIFLTVFRVFWWKSMQHLSEKTQFPGFLFPQVVQKH